MLTIAEGDNFALTLTTGVLRLDVWERRDLSFERGAELAKIMEGHIAKAASRTDVRGVMIDFRRAPVVWGPVTEAAITRLVRSVASADKRLAGVSVDTVQRFQVSNTLREAAPKHVRVFEDPKAAVRWLVGTPSN